MPTEENKKEKKIINKLPEDAEYQGVNNEGNPIYYSKSKNETYISLQGYGTPLYGKPKFGNKFKVISEKKLKEVV